MIVMPLTYSITNGIGAGVINYVIIKVARGKVAEIRPIVLISALAFLLYFALPALNKAFGI